MLRNEDCLIVSELEDQMPPNIFYQLLVRIFEKFAIFHQIFKGGYKAGRVFEELFGYFDGDE